METLQEEKVAVITGGNAGIGFALAQRLVKTYPKIRLCLACRNPGKVKTAAESLKKLSPTADIQTVILDTSSIKSVYAAASDLKHRYPHIDLLYLNAGAMVVAGVDWDYVLKSFFSRRIFHMFATGEGALKYLDWVSEDGLQAMFQTNLFGHYIFVKELESSLGMSSCAGSTSKVIWTSSSAAQKSNFSISNIQHKNGKNPYSSSKYAADVVSVGLNARLNSQGVFSQSVCPGLVESNLTYGILPTWFWKLLFPLILLMRLFVPSLTTSTFNGSEALVWLSSQDPHSLDPQTKYMSSASVFGKPYVLKEKMKIDMDQAEKLLVQLDELEQDFAQQYGHKH